MKGNFQTEYIESIGKRRRRKSINTSVRDSLYKSSNSSKIYFPNEERSSSVDEVADFAQQTSDVAFYQSYQNSPRLLFDDNNNSHPTTSEKSESLTPYPTSYSKEAVFPPNRTASLLTTRRFEVDNKEVEMGNERFLSKSSSYLNTTHEFPGALPAHSTKSLIPWDSSWSVDFDALRNILSSSSSVQKDQNASKTKVESDHYRKHNAKKKQFLDSFFSSSFSISLYTDSDKLFQTDSVHSLFTKYGSDLKNYSSNKQCFWLDLSSSSFQELQMLAKVYNIHPLTLEDIIEESPREKCDVFDSYVFLSIATTDFDPSSEAYLEPCFLFVLLYPDFIISIHHKTLSTIPTLLRRIDRSQLPISSDWIMYALVDDIVDGFIPIIGSMEMEVDSIEDLVLVVSEINQVEMLIRIANAKKRVTRLSRLLSPKTEIIKILVKRLSTRLMSNTLIYLRDIQDHVISITQNLNYYNESLNRSHSDYLTQISIELSLASNRMNFVLKKFTAFTALFLPISIIPGIWGMNCPVPWGGHIGDSSDYFPFAMIILIMLIIMILLIFIGRKNQWF